jgi:8-oxo-dGTP pyrophosphatase MutT (NUDIX family)
MKKYRKSIFAVVYRIKNNKLEYLILKRKLHWNGFEFPKGGLKFLEPKILGVKREVKEETGLKILKIKKYNVFGFYDYDKYLEDRKNIIGQEFSLYSVMVKDGKVKLDKLEHESYEWCDFNKALKKLTWENQKQCLTIVNRELTKELIKRQEI